MTQLAVGRDFVLALGLTLPHSELENMNKRKQMLDEAARINSIEPPLARQHRRSSSKSTLGREFGSQKKMERITSPGSNSKIPLRAKSSHYNASK